MLGFEPGPQKGRRRLNHGAVAAAQDRETFTSVPVIMNRN